MPLCSRHVEEALELARKMIELADLRLGDCGHDECLLLDGVIRDNAYEIRAAAERCRLELLAEAGAPLEADRPAS